MSSKKSVLILIPVSEQSLTQPVNISPSKGFQTTHLKVTSTKDPPSPGLSISSLISSTSQTAMASPKLLITLLENFLWSSSLTACLMGVLKVCGGIRTRSEISDKMNITEKESVYRWKSTEYQKYRINRLFSSRNCLLMSNRIKKPINTSKSSDRRLAGGRKPESFLHGSAVNVVKTITKPTTSTVSSNKTVKRSDGSKSWNDNSLLEWNPKHFRLFVGNLAADANDQLLLSAFGKYPTVSKVKVPIDNRTGENKGYGFVAFESADDYLRAFKEMNGKYVGQHPVQLKRAETVIKPTKRGKGKGKR